MLLYSYLQAPWLRNLNFIALHDKFHTTSQYTDHYLKYWITNCIRIRTMTQLTSIFNLSNTSVNLTSTTHNCFMLSSSIWVLLFPVNWAPRSSSLRYILYCSSHLKNLQTPCFCTQFCQLVSKNKLVHNKLNNKSILQRTISYSIEIGAHVVCFSSIPCIVSNACYDLQLALWTEHEGKHLPATRRWRAHRPVCHDASSPFQFHG